MKVIGITGGVGSGKSEVLGILERDFGAELLIADEIAHQVMEPGMPAYRRIVEALGTDFLSEDGSIDRKGCVLLSGQRVKGLAMANRSYRKRDTTRDRTSSLELAAQGTFRLIRQLRKFCHIR